jgi:hypothetical protein
MTTKAEKTTSCIFLTINAFRKLNDQQKVVKNME